ncbi:filaggrin-like [Littorina saxatilis]|uniref:filaggrin-like n=1 Tax=Littorina saxatilis TaxID=31220 RepID=UPI0038B454F8
MESRAYFGALLLNKHCAVMLSHEERRIDKQQRMMYNRVWRQKELLMDDYVHINIRTPSPQRPTQSSASSGHHRLPSSPQRIVKSSGSEDRQRLGSSPRRNVKSTDSSGHHRLGSSPRRVAKSSDSSDRPRLESFTSGRNMQKNTDSGASRNHSNVSSGAARLNSRRKKPAVILDTAKATRSDRSGSALISDRPKPKSTGLHMDLVSRTEEASAVNPQKSLSLVASGKPEAQFATGDLELKRHTSSAISDDERRETSEVKVSQTHQLLTDTDQQKSQHAQLTFLKLLTIDVVSEHQEPSSHAKVSRNSSAPIIKGHPGIDTSDAPQRHTPTDLSSGTDNPETVDRSPPLGSTPGSQDVHKASQRRPSLLSQEPSSFDQSQRRPSTSSSSPKMMNRRLSKQSSSGHPGTSTTSQRRSSTASLTGHRNQAGTPVSRSSTPSSSGPLANSPSITKRSTPTGSAHGNQSPRLVNSPRPIVKVMVDGATRSRSYPLSAYSRRTSLSGRDKFEKRRRSFAQSHTFEANNDGCRDVAKHGRRYSVYEMGNEHGRGTILHEESEHTGFSYAHDSGLHGESRDYVEDSFVREDDAIATNHAQKGLDDLHAPNREVSSEIPKREITSANQCSVQNRQIADTQPNNNRRLEEQVSKHKLITSNEKENHINENAPFGQQTHEKSFSPEDPHNAENGEEQPSRPHTHKKQHVRQLTLDPKLVLPLTAQRYRCKKQATIIPVIAVYGHQATLYPNSEAKVGRVVTLDRRVRGWLERTTSILSCLEKIHCHPYHVSVLAHSRVLPWTSPEVLNSVEDYRTSSQRQGSAGFSSEEKNRSSAGPSSLKPLSTWSSYSAESSFGSDDEDTDDDDSEIVLVPQTIYQDPESTPVKPKSPRPPPTESKPIAPWMRNKQQKQKQERMRREKRQEQKARGVPFVNLRKLER